jgi:predicted nucleotidyltransferase component of viral defense system
MEIEAMITREELIRAAKLKGIQAYQEEKEYLQLVFLNAISKEEGFIFKGGTCLRLAYNYVRFSEDLDFNVSFKPKRVQGLVNNALKSFRLLGAEYSFVKEELFENNYTSVIRFRGPLYVNRDDSTNSIRLDIGKRRSRTKSIIQIREVFSDVPSFFIACMSQEEILAEKVRALLMEPKPRHLFDIWLMKNNKVALNKKLIKDKLEDVRGKLVLSKREYERDLKDLVYPLVPYEQVIKEVKEFLGKAVG